MCWLILGVFSAGTMGVNPPSPHTLGLVNTPCPQWRQLQIVVGGWACQQFSGIFLLSQFCPPPPSQPHCMHKNDFLTKNPPLYTKGVHLIFFWKLFSLRETCNCIFLNGILQFRYHFRKSLSKCEIRKQVFKTTYEQNKNHFVIKPPLIALVFYFK